jgi:hypothetical protein
VVRTTHHRKIHFRYLCLHFSNPRLSSLMASCDAASSICLAQQTHFEPSFLESNGIM